MAVMENTKTTVIDDPQRPHFTPMKRLAFGMGNYGCCFSFMLIGQYLMYFFTDIALIDAGLVGTVMLLTRFLDAIIDPPIGAWADKQQSKHGHYRPFVLFASVPMLIFNVLLFTTFPEWSQTARTVWALGIYIIQVTLYSLVNIPFSAMPAVLTLDTTERAKLSAYRMSGAYISGLIISLLALRMVAWVGKGDDAKGMFWAVVLFSTLALPCFLWCFFGTKEVVKPKVANVPTRIMYKTIKGNRPMWLIFAVFSIMGFSSGGSSLNIYYFTYIAGDRLYSANNSIFGSFGSLAGTFLVGYLVTKLANKGRVVQIAVGIQCICNLIKYFLPVANPGMIYVYYALSFCASVGGGISLSCLYSMSADTTEYTLYHHGIYAAGFMLSFINMGNQLGSAIMSASSAWILAAVKYVPNQPQTPQALAAINFMCHIYTAIMSLCSFIAMGFYNLDKKTYDEYVEKTERGEFAPGVKPIFLKSDISEG